MYKGAIGVFVSCFVKVTLTVMIMFLVLWVCSLIGYYDAPEMALGGITSFENLLNNMLDTDYSYYGIEVLGGWGVFSTIFSVAMELICKINSVEYSAEMFTGVMAVNLILTAVMTSISVSVPLKLYLAMAKNMNRRASGFLSKIVCYGIDLFPIALIISCGVLSASGLTRRVSLLTAGNPAWLNFIVYIAILIGVSVVLAVVDGKLRNCNGKFFKGVLKISVELLYNVLVAAEALCILAVFLILKSIDENAITVDYYNMFGIGIVLILILIATVFISNRKK